MFQQHLLAAEEGELRPVCAPCDVSEVLDSSSADLRTQPVAAGRDIDVACPPGVQVATDRLLLEHALRGLVRHALAASSAKDSVEICAVQDADGGVAIGVRQPRALPPSAEASVFTPSISARGDAGQDVGTYAARLFVETYLGGRVTYASSEATGTTFEIRLPALAPLAPPR